MENGFDSGSLMAKTYFLFFHFLFSFSLFYQTLTGLSDAVRFSDFPFFQKLKKLFP